MRSTSSEVAYQDVAGRIDDFMARFKMSRLLYLSGIRKVRAMNLFCVVGTVFQIAFIGGNVYTGVHTSAIVSRVKNGTYAKDARRFLRDAGFPWNRLNLLNGLSDSEHHQGDRPTNL